MLRTTSDCGTNLLSEPTEAVVAGMNSTSRGLARELQQFVVCRLNNLQRSATVCESLREESSG